MFWALTARLGLERPLAAALRSLLLSVGVFVLALKLHRVVIHPASVAWYARPALLLPDLAFSLGFAALCASICTAFGWVRVPKAGLVFCQLLALLVVLFLLIAHGYYLASGQTLDYAMFAFSFMRANETFGVVKSEASLPLTAALCLVPAWLMVAPWRAMRAASTASAHTIAPWHRGVALGACVTLATLAFLGTYPPRLRGVERTFARDSVSYFVLGAFDVMFPRERYHGTPTRLRKLGARKLTAKAETTPKNLVLIILESTRADATTPYAPKLDTTPFLARLAKESVLVDRAYAVVPHTSKALVAILCGYEPNMTISVIESLKSALPGRCLPALLAAQGYETAFFQAPTAKFENRGVLVKNLGFKRFRSGDDSPRKGMQRINYFGYEDAIMLDPSRRFISGLGGKPFFAAYLTNASHHPYDVPKGHPHKRYAERSDKNKYLNAVRYVDGVVEQIVEQYAQAGLYDDTVFVVLGDHGEAFGEHGLLVHDDVMFEEGLRIPLVMRLPNAERKGTRIPGPFSELAVVPTLLDVLGFEHDGEYESTSWFERDREPVLHASCYRADRCAALMRDDHKLIYYFDDREPRLYDLAKDPGELEDIAADHETRVEAMTKELLDLRLSVHETYRKASERALSGLVSSKPPKKIEAPLRASFGEYFDLIGYHAPSERSLATFGRGANRRFEMGYYLHVKKTPPRGYQLRNELRAPGQTVIQYHSPVKALLPIVDFRPGQYIDDIHHVHMPSEWRKPTLEICFALVDEHEIPVPVTTPDGKQRSCMPIMTLQLKR